MTTWQERAERAEQAADALAELIEAIHGAMATDPRDWSAWSRDAWYYGVVVGWSDGPEDREAIDEIAQAHPRIDIANMERLHSARALYAQSVNARLQPFANRSANLCNE